MGLTCDVAEFTLSGTRLTTATEAAYLRKKKLECVIGFPSPFCSGWVCSPDISTGLV